MKVTLPFEIVKNACILSKENGCGYSEPEIMIEYRDNMYKVSDRNFADDNLVYLHNYNGHPVHINDCLIDVDLLRKIKKSQKNWLITELNK